MQKPDTSSYYSNSHYYSIDAGNSLVVHVLYSPSTVGTHEGIVTLSGGGGATVGVSGSAYPAPAISVTPASLDFGTVSVGATSDLTFTVQNTGGGTLSGTASVAAPFSVVSGGSYDLAAGASQAVTVRYSPTGAGTHSGTVTFTGGGGATRPVTGNAYNNAVADFDGDGITDIALMRKVTGNIGVRGSRDGDFSSPAGNPAWVPAVGDYDGDRITDFAWYLPD
jgi:hypothetical protein